MRAGLLSDPRVVALLRRDFVPCVISALNTVQCLADPRDAETLARYVDPKGEDFDGGEREVFILPDGTMLGVFLSLHGSVPLNGKTHFTRAGRHTEDAVVVFKRHAREALERTDGGVPPDWAEVWEGGTEDVAAIAATVPQWPLPARDEQALRVFVRNSYRMYEDLAGCELVALDAATVAALLAACDEVGARVALPVTPFRALVNAMVPRGQVGTHLADESIDGVLELCVDELDGDSVRGHIEGRYAMVPGDRSEVGLRSNAACLFTSSGRFVGRFTIDRSAKRVVELRAAILDVEFEWLPRYRPLAGEFPAVHAAAIEWVRGAR